MNASFRARYCSGQSPLESEVSVLSQDASFIVHGPWLEPLVWKFSQLRSQSLAEGTLYLHRESDATLLIYHELTSSYQKLPGVDRLLHASSFQKGSKLLLLLALCTGLMLALWGALDPLTQKLAQSISPKRERMLFASDLQAIEKKDKTCDLSQANLVLQTLGNQLSLAEQKEAPIDFILVDWELANAFAVPGRRIFVTKGLLRQLDSSEQLAAVLSHEIAHVHLRHNLQAFLRNTLSTALWGLLVGDISGAFVIDPQMAKNISELSYSRELETAADKFSAQRMKSLAYNPHSLISALERIELFPSDEQDLRNSKASSLLLTKIRSWLSTHPTLEQRKSQLASFSSPTEGREPLPPEAWMLLKNPCASPR